MQFIHPILYLLYFLVFVFIIRKWRYFEAEGAGKKHFILFFTLKVVAGLTLTSIYTYYYTDHSKSDIYRYFNDSKVISDLLFSDAGAWLKVMTGIGLNEPETFRHILPTLYFSHPEGDLATSNHFIIRIISILNFFSLYNIYTNTLLLNFISFIGLTALFKAFTRFFQEFPQILFLPIYLLPSVVFWSSGLLKEQIIFALLGPLFAILLSRESKNYLQWILLILLLAMIYATKPQVAVTVLLVILPLLAMRWKAKTRMIVGAVLLTGLLLILWTNTTPSFCEKVIDKRAEFIDLAIRENAVSYSAEEIRPENCQGVVAFALKAFLQAFLHPLIWEKGPVFQLLAAIENSLLLLTIAFLLIRFHQWRKGEVLVLVVCLLSFALTNYLIIGITVPITGAMVHYRVIAIPFFLIAVLLFTNHAKLKVALSQSQLFKL